MFRANNFDKLLDKATSNLRLDPDWPTILQICDLIRQNDCSAKYAVSAVKKKLYSQNPHQAMFAMLVLESVVKNCGSGIHDEVTSKAFCETLRDLVKSTQHENLKTKILELIQAWAFAFRNTPKYRAVQDTVNILKAEGFKFLPLKESDAMFSADTAPEWADGEVCHRCRVAFSLMVRRHHCRACGQVFCQQCSSKTSTLPKFGIEKEVRVCDACFEKVSRPPTAAPKLEIVDTSSDYGPTQPQKRTGKSAEELQEEEELQLALALSQSEAEHKEKERTKSRSYIAPEPAPQIPTVSPTPSSVSASPEHGSGAGASAELSRYLDRGYWEQRLSRDPSSAAPTAPASQPTISPPEDFSKAGTSNTQEEDAEDKELDEFVGTLKSQVEIFVNRMKSNSSRGRSIANDTSVQTLFMNITAMHSRLLRYIQQQDDKRVYLESLQDKVTQVRDSRAALDTLRAEHTARLAAAAEAAERQRQMQMAAKLQAMRKKKHEYLQYQRQLALQRVQEQEREMQMRQEQQKHHYMLATGGNFYVPNFQNAYINPNNFPKMQQYMPQSASEAPVSMSGQPQTSQANMMPMNMNQMGPMSQSMSQMPQSYPMSTSNVINQAPINAQASMNPPPHTALGQQIPIQSQMHLAQMHQMRLPVQPGVHQIMPQNLTNGLPGQNLPHQNGQQQQMVKQNIPNQQIQGPNPGVSQMPIGQQTLAQQNAANAAILGMQMHNMKLHLMQSNQGPAGQQVPATGYPVGHQQAPQVAGMSSQLPIQSQGMIQGQPHPGHGHGVHPQQPPASQGQLQIQQAAPGLQAQGQMLSHQQNIAANGQMTGHQMLNQQAPMQGQHQMPQIQLPGQQMQGQPQHHMQGHIPQQAQGVPPQQQFQPQQMPPQGQQIQQMQQQQGIPQQQQQQQPQQQQQQIKIPQQNFTPPNNQQVPPNNQQSQSQQVQTHIKTENNNNTAELISFD